MKWVTASEKRRLKLERRKKWHRVFAWWPRLVPANDQMPIPAHRVWLEHVERKWTYNRGGWFYEYRDAGRDPL